MDKDSEKPGAVGTTTPPSKDSSPSLLQQEVVDLKKQVELLENLVSYFKENELRWQDKEQQWEQKEQQWEQKEQQWEQKEQQWEQKEQQWEQKEQQWEQKEQQWEREKEETHSKIGRLESQMQDLVLLLKQSQGIVSSSEKGRNLKPEDGKSSNGGGGNGGDGGNDENDEESKPNPTSHEQKYLSKFSQKRALPKRLAEFATEYDFWKAKGSDLQYLPSKARIFSSQIFKPVERTEKFTFSKQEKREIFQRDSGLHSKKHETTAYQLEMDLTKLTCIQETLSCSKTGLRVTKGKSLGPAGTQMTWDTLATIVSLIAEYAFPMERMSTAIGHVYFNSGNISRWFINSAEPVLPIYLSLGHALGYASYLQMDDTSARVLEMIAMDKSTLKPDSEMSCQDWEEVYADLEKNLKRKKIKNLLQPIWEAFGRVATKVNSQEAKTSINVTLISGKLDPLDYTSKVYFYRTHFGQAGNLLSRILENRPKHRENEALHIQSDRSSQNNVEEQIAKLFNLTLLACTSHARRPFHRHRKDDRNLCFFMLRCFAALAKLEEDIKNNALSSDRILRKRGKFGEKIWFMIQRACQAVADEKVDPLAQNKQWKNGDSLFKACRYILKHFDELTGYLSIAESQSSNDPSEQGLRGEKLIESACHFRKSEMGRAALDIHRTLIATCNACDLEYKKFLQIVSEADPEDVKAHPDRFYPHVIAHSLRRPRGPPANSADHDISQPMYFN